MKNLLLLTALMVSVLPVEAEDTQLMNRARVIGAFAGAECGVRIGMFTQEQADDRVQDYINNHPHLNTAYSWATTSNKAMEAVQALTSHMDSECNFTISQYEAGKLMVPYLE